MLELDENGKLINITNKSIDRLKRESYKHSSQEAVLKEDAEVEEISSIVDSLEELEDGEDSLPEADLDPEAVDIAMAFAEFKANFVKTFGEEELMEAFSQFDDFFKEKGVDVAIDLKDMGDLEDNNIPGMESSEQSIVTK